MCKNFTQCPLCGKHFSRTLYMFWERGYGAMLGHSGSGLGQTLLLRVMSLGEQLKFNELPFSHRS